MIVYIGFGIMALTAVLSIFDLIFESVAVVMFFIGFLTVALPLLAAPKFEERKLVESYTVLPIVSGVYAIKTCDGKIIFKYLDFEEEDKVLIDTLSSWNEIEEIEDNSMPMLNIYEQKAKKDWLRVPSIDARYIEVLRIPKNSIITK